MATVLELSQKLERKVAEYQEFLDRFKTDKVDENQMPVFNMDSEAVGESVKRNNELAELGKLLDNARASEMWLVNQGRAEDLKGVERNVPRAANAYQDNAQAYARRDMSGQSKSIGERFIDSNEYKYRGATNRICGKDFDDIDYKTLISIGAGFTPPNYRTDTVVDYPNRRPMVADLIPDDPTTLQVVKWMENTTFTNNAAGVSEGGAKPESALVWTERSATVEKIATWVPVTEEQIDDVPALQGIINRDLVLMLQLVEENYLLGGTGVSPQMLGFLNAPNIQSQAKSSDDIADAIFKAFTLVRWTGFAEPSGVIINPTDWQKIRLLRTTDGLYIYGEPSVAGVDTLWGKKVVVTSAITQGTALTGDFMMYSHISRRMGIRLDIANQHASYFTSDLLVIRAELRESLEIKRQTAFAKITGL